MSDPPIMDAVCETVDQAELAGWRYLASRCACREVWHPWRMLRRETRYRRLDEIAVRLRCSTCGQRPSRVWLYWQGGQDMADKRERVILPHYTEEAATVVSQSRSRGGT